MGPVAYSGFPKTPEKGANLVFSQIFAEDCMKMKELVPKGHLSGDGSDIPRNAADRSLLQVSNWFCEVPGPSWVLDVSRALLDQTS